MLHDYNARDWGFEWVYAATSQNIRPVSKSELFSRAIKMREYIHVGHSCRVPGGCNNASPYEKHLYVKLKKIPATLELYLYKTQPKDLQEPDFRYFIHFR